MGNHPLVLTLSFALELAMLAAYGFWGWHTGAGPLPLLLALGAPLLAALLWGAFVSPRAMIKTPGIVRLLIELGLFAGSILALFSVGARSQAIVLLALLLVQQLARYKQIAEMLRQDTR